MKFTCYKGPWLAGVLVTVNTITSVQAEPVCSEEVGSCYEAVEAFGIAWQDARSAAEVRTHEGIRGRLATIGSEAENSFIVNSVKFYGNEFWIGAFQPANSPEPGGGWQWITGEPFVYTNWNTGEPNDAQGMEDGAAIYSSSGRWNDEGSAIGNIDGFLVEFVSSRQQFSIFSPRAEFTLGPKANDDSYKARGWFKLADASNGIDPLTEPVTIQYGSFSHTIPAGTFVQDGASYFYKGAVGPASLDVRITPKPTLGYYWLNSCLRHADLSATTLKPDVQLSIGDDSGKATLDVGSAKFGTGKSGQKWVFPPAE